MSEIKFEIVKKVGVISKSASGWAKELNLISWNDRDPKYDIRDWSADGVKNGQRRHLIQGRTAGFTGIIKQHRTIKQKSADLRSALFKSYYCSWGCSIILSKTAGLEYCLSRKRMRARSTSAITNWVFSYSESHNNTPKFTRKESP